MNGTPITKIKRSATANTRVMANPSYLVLAIAAAAFMFTTLVWFFNINLFLFVIRNETLNLTDKLGFLGSSYSGVFKNLQDFRASAMVAVSVFSGINLAVLVYVLRSSAKTAKTPGFRGMTVALLGSGCVACGGSILSPLFSQLGSAASLAVSQTVGVVAYSASLVLILYSLHGLGLSSAHIQSLKING